MMKIMRFKNRNILAITGIAALAASGLIYIFTAYSSDERPVLITEKSTIHAAVSPVNADTGNMKIFSRIFSAIFKHDMNPSDEDGEKINEELRRHNLTTVNVDEVKMEAGEVVLPYSTEEERREILKKLRDTEKVFNDMIGTAEKNINEAKSKGTRTVDEIKEAEDALTEMTVGRDFVSRRISLVEDDKK